jgi:hypothetical protein
MKIRSVGAELFHADGRIDGRKYGRRDMTELIVASHNFVNMPKIFFVRHSEHSALKKHMFCDRVVRAARDLLYGSFIDSDRNFDKYATSSNVTFSFLNCFYHRSLLSSRSTANS